MSMSDEFNADEFNANIHFAGEALECADKLPVDSLDDLSLRMAMFDVVHKRLYEAQKELDKKMGTNNAAKLAMPDYE